ncbi:hypothetical protein DFH27DRAFT_570738, partial [Peziza echinospora]
AHSHCVSPPHPSHSVSTNLLLLLLLLDLFPPSSPSSSAKDIIQRPQNGQTRPAATLNSWCKTRVKTSLTRFEAPPNLHAELLLHNCLSHAGQVPMNDGSLVCKGGWVSGAVVGYNM